MLAAFAAGWATGQTIDFTLLESYQGNSAIIPNGQALDFFATVGTSQQVTVKATYNGSTQATFTQQPQFIGSTEFTVTSNLKVPQTFSPGQSFTMLMTYSPTNANGAEAEFSASYTEPGPGTTLTQSTIALPLVGTSPAFTLSYILQANNNVVPISPGGTIPFGPTQINTTALANLDITNTGSGPGNITGIAYPVTGVFKVEGVPLTPFSLGSGSTLQLLVQYTPTAVENDTGQITITYQGGATATVNLAGSGTTSTFAYKYLVQGKATAVTPGGTITFPGANFGNTTGNTSSLIVQVTNLGSANGIINSVSTSGPFTLTNPITLPATVTPGNSFSVPLTFTPTEVGTQTGQLLIGNDFFNLSAAGLGADLTYAYTSSAGTIAVNPATGGAVVFSPVEVGQSAQVVFTVTNSGSLPATISNIGPSPSNGPYTLSGLPPLPLSLASGQSAHFTILFKPTATGFSDGTLVLDTTMISLIGSGTTPPVLPSYTITGPSGSTAALTQSNISLTLSSAYSLDLIGTLTLTTAGNFGTDPSVQFATGGRTVAFTIAAGSTSADFAGQGSLLPLQTGTVAESVTLTPDFTTAGGVDVTPSSPATLELTIASTAPVLLNAQVTNETSNGFDLVLIGYSTTRSLTSMGVTFNPAAGFNIGTGQLTLDVSQIATAWFSSSTSVSYGGQFAITMPFTLQGTAAKNQTLLDSIASVTATVSNGIGTSNSLQANVQ